jgi:hypothetical protein
MVNNDMVFKSHTLYILNVVSNFVATMRQLIIIGTLLTNLISCDIKDDSESFIIEDITKYNDQISQWRTNAESWTVDPVLITRELFRFDDLERKTIIEFENEAVDKVTVTLTQEGLSDDSVDGEKRIIDFEKVNGLWTIKQIRLGFKCWQNRGHTNYSGQPCS